MVLRELAADDRGWVARFLTQEAGDTRVVSRGTSHNADALPGIGAFVGGTPVGLLNYRIANTKMEVVTLYARLKGRGVGTALLLAAKEAAKRAGCTRLWLITTNDNRPAIEFYNRRGMRLVAVHKDAVNESRKLKPGIPLYGLRGEPITDELEFELLLDEPPAP